MPAAAFASAKGSTGKRNSTSSNLTIRSTKKSAIKRALKVYGGNKTPDEEQVKNNPVKSKRKLTRSKFSTISDKGSAAEAGSVLKI